MPAMQENGPTFWSNLQDKLLLILESLCAKVWFQSLGFAHLEMCCRRRSTESSWARGAWALQHLKEALESLKKVPLIAFQIIIPVPLVNARLEDASHNKLSSFLK